MTQAYRLQAVCWVPRKIVNLRDTPPLSRVYAGTASDRWGLRESGMHRSILRGSKLHRRHSMVLLSEFCLPAWGIYGSRAR